MSAKSKVSVTVAARLLGEVDRLAGEKGRSAIFEAALESWLHARRKTELDRDIERYYREISDVERAEDHSWAEASDTTVATSWDEPGE